MSLPDDLQIDLVDVWYFTEGIGNIAHGCKENYDLTLSRGQIFEEGDPPVNAGWGTEPSPSNRPTFKGGGFTPLAGLALLPTVGSGLTVAVRFWAGDVVVPFSGFAANSSSHGTQGAALRILGLRGQYETDSDGGGESGCQLIDYDIGTADPLIWEEVTGAGVFESPASWTWDKDPLPSVPQLAVVTITRTGTATVRVRLAINGVQASEFVDHDLADLDLTGLSVGPVRESIGYVSQASLWSRALNTTEIAYLGDNLDGLCSGVTTTPSITAIVFRWDVQRTDRGGTIETTGRQRHTRRRHERIRRGYRLTTSHTTAEEVGLLAGVLSATKGCTPVLWKHPQDDAAEVRYRITNAGEAEFGVARFRAGVRSEMVLELESV